MKPNMFEDTGRDHLHFWPSLQAHQINVLPNNKFPDYRSRNQVAIAAFQITREELWLRAVCLCFPAIYCTFQIRRFHPTLQIAQYWLCSHNFQMTNPLTRCFNGLVWSPVRVRWDNIYPHTNTCHSDTLNGMSVLPVNLKYFTLSHSKPFCLVMTQIVSFNLFLL